MNLTYELIRSGNRHKTLSLTVKQGGRIEIRAPRHVPRAEIDGFFNRKLAWIRRKLADVTAPREPAAGAELTAGDEAMFLGVSYPVIMNGDGGGSAGLSFDGERFLLAPADAAAGKDLLRVWYRRAAASFLPARVAFFAELWGCRCRSVRISKARARWGSCSADNRLAFSWRLMMVPPPVIDYVVVHELAHIREKNHSPRFWALVGELCPDYRERRRWLRSEGAELFR